MSEPVWNKFLTERDKAVFAASGYGARGGFGKRPALLIIAVNWAFCGDRPEPILESIKRWRNSCGEDAWKALPYIRSLIDKCHEKGVPVLYTTGVRREDNWDSGSWGWKNSRNEEDRRTVVTNLDGNEIVAPLAPAPQDIVVLKQKPSGFFGNDAVRAALVKYGNIRRIAVITPYMPVGDAQVRRFFEDCGFKIVALKGLKCGSPVQIAHVSEKQLRDALIEVDDSAVEAIVQVGTNLAMARLAAIAEFWIDKPVIAINTAIYWHALRQSGVADRVPGFGSLLGEY